MDLPPEKKRLFVRGLFDGIKDEDIIEKFSRFGQVESVDIKPKRTDEQSNSIAFIEIMITPKNLAKCFNAYSNTRWKGCELKLEVAKESFLSRLQKEREASNQSQGSASTPNIGYEPKPAKNLVPSTVSEHHDDEKRSKGKKRSAEPPSPIGKSKSKVPMFRGTAGLLQNEGGELGSADAKKAKKSKYINGQSVEEESVKRTRQEDSIEEAAHANFEQNGYENIPRSNFRNSQQFESQKSHSNGLLSRLEKFSGTWNDFEVVGSDTRVSTSLSMTSEKKKRLNREFEVGNDLRKPVTSTAMLEKKFSDKDLEVGRKDARAILEKNLHAKSDSVVVKSQARIPSSSITISEKKKLSDKKRLETINSKLSESSAKQKLIKYALKNLDSGYKMNSKIVFDDEYDEKKTVDSQFTLEEQSQENCINGSKVERNMTLFGSDSEEELPMDSQDMFRVKPQFEGEAGQKFIALQSRFGNDERFKIDERFVDAESDRNDDEDEEFDSKQETRRQLGVLAGVLGYELPKKPKDKLAKDWRKTKQMRYDPTQKDAAELEIQEEDQIDAKTEGQKGKATKSSELNGLPVDDPLPEVSQERYYKVSTSLKDIFNSGKKSENESFSLLQSFGAVAPSKDTLDHDIPNEKAVNLPRTGWDSNPFKYDSSSDEEDEKLPISGGKKKSDKMSEAQRQDGTIESKTHQSSTRRTFFIFDGDTRLEDGVTFFTRPNNLDEVRQNWPRTRLRLMQEFRVKLKKAQQEKVGKTKMAAAPKKQFDGMKSKFKAKKKKKKVFNRKRQ